VDDVNNNQKARIPYRAIGTNVLAAGLGTLTGYYGGGALLRALSKSPKVQNYLNGLPREKQRAFLEKLQVALTTLGGAAGVGAASVSVARLQAEADRLRREEEKTRGTKVASVYRVYRLGLEQE
jgi:hypothetical protein